MKSKCCGVEAGIKHFNPDGPPTWVCPKCGAPVEGEETFASGYAWRVPGQPRKLENPGRFFHDIPIMEWIEKAERYIEYLEDRVTRLEKRRNYLKDTLDAQLQLNRKGTEERDGLKAMQKDGFISYAAVKHMCQQIDDLRKQLRLSGEGFERRGFIIDDLTIENRELRKRIDEIEKARLTEEWQKEHP